jgi:hypothetical protein
MNDHKQRAFETMVAFRQARNTHPPGSKEWEDINREFENAELEYIRAASVGDIARDSMRHAI